MDMGFIAEDDVACFLIGQLGCDSRSHGRERKKAYRRMVCEVFSPPRVTDEIRRLPNITIAGGSTYDLFADRNGRTFDFTKAADRRKGRRGIEETKPYFVIGSPPCTAFSSLMKS